MRRKSGNSPRSRSITIRRSACCKSVRVMQHRQPFPSRTVSSVLGRTSASSMPVAPNSLTTTAVPCPSAVARKCFSNVVFPAPRKPVITITGSRAPRSRLSLRPNWPAAGEGKSSFRNPSPACTGRRCGDRRYRRSAVHPRTHRLAALRRPACLSAVAARTCRLPSAGTDLKCRRRADRH
jgi:hypothetical protein